MLKVGTRKQVMNGEAVKTSGGLMAGDLRVNKYGKIVSVKVSDNAINRLNNMKGGGEIYLEKIYKSQFVRDYTVNNNSMFVNNKYNNKHINYKYINNKKDFYNNLNIMSNIYIKGNEYMILFKTDNYIIVINNSIFNINEIANCIIEKNAKHKCIDKIWKKQLKLNIYNNKKNLEKLNNRQLKSKLIVYKHKSNVYKLGQIIDINNKFFGKTTYKIKPLDTNDVDEVLLYKHGSNNKSRIPFFIVRDFVKTGNITLQNNSGTNFRGVYN